MASISSAITSGAYSGFTEALDIANAADAMKNDLIKFENEKHNREVQTIHKEMKDTSENTRNLQF